MIFSTNEQLFSVLEKYDLDGADIDWVCWISGQWIIIVVVAVLVDEDTL